MSCMLVSCKKTTLGSGRAGIASLNGKKQCIAVGGLTSSIDIANYFADNFASTLFHRMKGLNVNMLILCLSGSVENTLLDSEHVQTAIAKLKYGKAPGIDGETASVIRLHIYTN